MWPAVEAALRNIAYTRSREARRHGTPANTQIASADADAVDVRELKSAVVPLIMSFNSETRRNAQPSPASWARISSPRSSDCARPSSLPGIAV